eukprot:6450068-Amphidinium_carterae.1
MSKVCIHPVVALCNWVHIPLHCLDPLVRSPRLQGTSCFKRSSKRRRCAKLIRTEICLIGNHVELFKADSLPCGCAFTCLACLEFKQ